MLHTLKCENSIVPTILSIVQIWDEMMFKAMLYNTLSSENQTIVG